MYKITIYNTAYELPPTTEIILNEEQFMALWRSYETNQALNSDDILSKYGVKFEKMNPSLINKFKSFFN